MKIIGTNITYATRFFLSLCVCVSTGLTATSSQDSTIANGLLKALTPPAGTETTSLLQAVSGAKEVHFHVGNNPQTTPAQPQQQIQQPAARGFFAEFFIQHPILCISAVTATVGTGAYFIRSVLHKRRIEAEQTRLANLLTVQGRTLGTVQTGVSALKVEQTRQSSLLEAQSQILGTVQTGVNAVQAEQAEHGGLLRTQGEALRVVQASQALHGQQLTIQGRTLQELSETATNGFRANAANQEKNEQANQAIRSEVAAHKKETEAGFNALAHTVMQTEARIIDAQKQGLSKQQQWFEERFETGSEEQRELVNGVILAQGVANSRVDNLTHEVVGLRQEVSELRTQFSVAASDVHQIQSDLAEVLAIAKQVKPRSSSPHQRARSSSPQARPNTSRLLQVLNNNNSHQWVQQQVSSPFNLDEVE